MRRPAPSYAERCTTWDKQQREAAEAILERVGHYGGEQAALVQWARLHIAKVEREQLIREAPLLADAGGC